jgi:hypothetical protein
MRTGRRGGLDRRLAARRLAAGDPVSAAASKAGGSPGELHDLLRHELGFRILVDEYRREARLPEAARLELLRARCIAGARRVLASGQRLSARDRAVLENLVRSNPPPDPLAPLRASLTPEALRAFEAEDGPGSGG